MKASHQINILVLPRETIPEKYLSSSFVPISKDELAELCKTAEFKWRADMEHDSKYKQPIPYIAVFSNKKILTFKRSKTGGEGRLYDKYSLAIGGHIDEVSEINTTIDTLYESVEREVEEEINLDINPHNVEIIGTINGETGADEFHIGIAMKFTRNDFDLNQGEQDQLLERKLMTKSEVLEIYDKLESWSQKYFDHYLKGVLD